jgi:hypothetical protein
VKFLDVFLQKNVKNKPEKQLIFKGVLKGQPPNVFNGQGET